MREVVAAIILSDKRLLVVKKKGTWITPGGKLVAGELYADCLRREVAEELSGTRITNIRAYKIFEGIGLPCDGVVRVHFYFTDIDGGLGKIASELEDYTWARKHDSLNMTEPTRELFESLKREGYLG